MYNLIMINSYEIKESLVESKVCTHTWINYMAASQQEFPNILDQVLYYSHILQGYIYK